MQKMDNGQGFGLALNSPNIELLTCVSLIAQMIFFMKNVNNIGKWRRPGLHKIEVRQGIVGSLVGEKMSSKWELGPDWLSILKPVSGQLAC